MIVRTMKGWFSGVSRILVLLALINSCHRVVAQITFQRTYGPSIGDYGYSVLQTLDGGYYVAGIAGLEIGGVVNNLASILHTDDNGDTLWYKYFSTLGSTDLSLEHMIQSADGNLVVTGVVNYGLIDGFSDYDAYVAKIDTNGNLLWSTTIGGPFKQWGKELREAPDGGYICAGWNSVIGGANQGACYLIKLNSGGNVLWTRTYTNNDDQIAYAVAGTADGGWVVAGTTQPGGDTPQVLVIRTNTLGDTLWTRTLDTLGFGYAHDVMIIDDGHIMIAGFSFPDGNYARPVLIELNENGDLLWYRNYQHTGAGLAEWCFSMCKTTTGYALLNMDSNYDAFWLTNVDANGDTLWTKGFTVNGGYAYSVEQTSDGGFILCGTTYLGSIQIALIKTDASGNVTTSTHDIALDPSVAATLFPNPVAGMSTFQYSTTGSGAYTLVLHDGVGRVVRSIFINERRAPGEYEEPIDLTGLPSGAYTLVLSNGQRAVSVKAMKL